MDVEIKRNKKLYTIAWILMIYSIMELGDCVIMLLIALKLFPNIFVQFGEILFPIFFEMTNNVTIVTPLLLMLFFLSFTIMRLISSIGIFKNRLWGFYIAVIDLILTIFIAILFIPLGIIEILICSLILVVLIIGKYENQKIIEIV